ncbi:MAG: type II toxin-antitoxin system VapC family toxin [Betaproteobacteria bacterium]|nr:type II toxin-antitoxin system VapC family toxin [Betaproteobacteria bacterium]
MDYVRRYVQHADEYYGLIVVSVLGMVLLPASGEMLTAYVALELLTRGAGLSLGDRMCLSLARALDLPAYMADRTWANVSVDVKIVVIR